MQYGGSATRDILVTNITLTLFIAMLILTPETVSPSCLLLLLILLHQSTMMFVIPYVLLGPCSGTNTRPSSLQCALIFPVMVSVLTYLQCGWYVK
jgi:hypothetical protein